MGVTERFMIKADELIGALMVSQTKERRLS